jgi:hypothetical protein
MNDEIYNQVAAQLRTMTSVKAGSLPISPETEIYADLKIYGDDLFEFLIWIRNQFGVQVTVAGGKYAPSEIPFFKVVEAFKKTISGETHRYKSLRIRDVVQAIEAGGGQFD